MLSETPVEHTLHEQSALKDIQTVIFGCAAWQYWLLNCQRKDHKDTGRPGGPESRRATEVEKSSVYLQHSGQGQRMI